MGQQEVFDFLKKNEGRWWTSKEIAMKLNSSVGSVTTNLNKLRKREEIQFKRSKEKHNTYLYMHRI
ncbi:hypothetical protein A3K72_04320 [Candidatus Woesearchaeota archaeon RBG_13_36_6]|nr:MAG: hypothetical protein A3K72_04320 [Candidatus Woesearchaeota archaeon RBG_13_36_6]